MVRKFIQFWISFWFKVRYIFTGKTRKDAWVDHVKKNGGMFVAYKNKYKTSQPYARSRKAPSIK